MKFGLIGHPIAHSLSPALFKAGYDSRYPYQLIKGADFEVSYRRFLEGMMHKDLSRKAKELEQAFEKEYGPLSMGTNQNEESWDWVCDPWPWQHQ